MKGKDIKKYYNKYDNLWLIFTRKKSIDIDKFPKLKSFLTKYKNNLLPRNKNKKVGRKPGTYKWYEIQDNTAYYKMFDKQKIIWPLTADKWGFCFWGGLVERGSQSEKALPLQIPYHRTWLK